MSSPGHDDDPPGYAGPRVPGEGWTPAAGPEVGCTFCGGAVGHRIHPLHVGRTAYRLHGKGHTLPTWWSTCTACEQLVADHARGRLAALLAERDGGTFDDALLAVDVFFAAELGGRPL